MKPYFSVEHTCSIEGSAQEVIRTVAYKYIKNNPAKSFSYRAFSDKEFKRDAEGYFQLDFDKRFPEAQEGDYAYAFAQFFSLSEETCSFWVGTHNPAEFYINDKLVAQTNIYDEFVHEGRAVLVSVKKGRNTVFIKCRKNALGFRCVFGNQYHKSMPIHFYKAFQENQGELGWNYCGPFSLDIYAKVPQTDASMENFWLPRPYVNELPCKEGHSEMYAVSTLLSEGNGTAKISCQADAKLELYVNGVLCGEGTERLCEEIDLAKGKHDISIRLQEIKPGCSFRVVTEGATIKLPDCVEDVRGNWLYLDSKDVKAKQGFRKYELYEGYENDEQEFFLCGKDTYIRPVLEEELFGRATYPNGVVLYGLLKAGEYLNDNEILDYVHEHLKCCFASLNYALWDMKKFGRACINHKLVDMVFLDDCGSFSATVLEDYLHHHQDEAVLPYAAYIADYILYRQERLENGMFYREAPGLYQQKTIWADDLYMSTPFLIRYALLTGNQMVLDDAVRQFLCYKEKLYMDEDQLMGHVYSLRHQQSTRVPWGRGNGWVLFSLTELLAVLPKEHEHYAKIKEFFVQLAQGFLKCVDETGMLHQVLWDKDSFEEASSTAMCAASFARGIRMGILQREIYQEPSERCVEALKRFCIDENGNIYGVCRGSGYSFREDYYKYEIPCVLNDTHGTGIVIIAMIEVERNSQENII